MLERMRKQKEKERTLAMIARPNDTESEESSGEETTTDWNQEIAKFKNNGQPGKINLKLKTSENKHIKEFKDQCKQMQSSIGKKRFLKCDNKLEQQL